MTQRIERGDLFHKTGEVSSEEEANLLLSPKNKVTELANSLKEQTLVDPPPIDVVMSDAPTSQ